MSGAVLAAELRGDEAERARAVDKIREAITQAGTLTDAAPLLGVSVRTLRRWIAASPALVAEVQRAGRGRPRRPPPTTAAA